MSSVNAIFVLKLAKTNQPGNQHMLVYLEIQNLDRCNFLWWSMISPPMYHSTSIYDITIFEFLNLSCPSFLQIELDKICNWSTTNNMKINAQKTKELRISFLKHDSPVQPLTADGRVIDTVTHFKLLGVYRISHLISLGPIMYIISVPRQAKDSESVLFIPKNLLLCHQTIWFQFTVRLTDR